MDSKFQTFVAQNISNEVRLADTKASWTFGVLGVTGATLTNELAKVGFSEASKGINLFLIVICTIFIILAIKHTMAVIFPRISKGKKEGITYFGNISTYKKSEYVKRVLSLSEKENIREAAMMAHDLSGIAKRKYYHLKIGIIYTLAALLTTILIIVLI